LPVRTEVRRPCAAAPHLGQAAVAVTVVKVRLARVLLHRTSRATSIAGVNSGRPRSTGALRGWALGLVAVLAPACGSSAQPGAAVAPDASRGVSADAAITDAAAPTTEDAAGAGADATTDAGADLASVLADYSGEWAGMTSEGLKIRFIVNGASLTSLAVPIRSRFRDDMCEHTFEAGARVPLGDDAFKGELFPKNAPANTLLLLAGEKVIVDGKFTSPTQSSGTVNQFQAGSFICGAVLSAGTTAMGGFSWTATRADCSAPRSFCSSQCVDTSSDPDNCGACRNVCPSGMACQGGSCACAAMCQGACADTSRDANNCGACGHDCLGGACQAGLCQPLTLASGQGNLRRIVVDASSV
jgi:hypothetical protein